jgi:hypothetical protein
MKLINQLGKLLLFSVFFTSCGGEEEIKKENHFEVLRSLGKSLNNNWIFLRDLGVGLVSILFQNTDEKKISYKYLSEKDLELRDIANTINNPLAEDCSKINTIGDNRDQTEINFWYVADNINNYFTGITNRADCLTKTKEISFFLGAQCEPKYSRTNKMSTSQNQEIFNERIPSYANNRNFINNIRIKRAINLYNVLKYYNSGLLNRESAVEKSKLCESDFNIFNDLIKNKTPQEAQRAFIQQFRNNYVSLAGYVSYFGDEQQVKKIEFIKNTGMNLLNKIDECYNLPE